MPFPVAWSWQQHWQERLLAFSTRSVQNDHEVVQPPEAVWLLQHPSCYTLGRGASEQQPPAEWTESSDFERISSARATFIFDPLGCAAYP